MIASYLAPVEIRRGTESWVMPEATGNLSIPLSRTLQRSPLTIPSFHTQVNLII